MGFSGTTTTFWAPQDLCHRCGGGGGDRAGLATESWGDGELAPLIATDERARARSEPDRRANMLTPPTPPPNWENATEMRDVSLSKNLTEAFERSSQAANARLRRLFVSARRKPSVEALPLRRHIKQELCGVEALAAFCLQFAALLDELLYPHHVDVAQGAA